MKARLQRLVHRLATERTTPARTGVAVAVGVLIGTSPFFGLHFPLCLAAATVLGVNRAITYLASQVSFPPLFPFLTFASVQVGSLVLHGHTLPVELATIETLELSGVARDWLVGSLLVGSALALPAGLGAYAAVRAYRARHPAGLAPET